MKKYLLIALISLFSLNSYSQVGDLNVGVEGGYLLQYSNPMFGLNVGYMLTDHMEVSLKGIMHPSVKVSDFSTDDKFSLYSLDLCINYYIIHMRDWGIGPAVGCGFASRKDKESTGFLDDDGLGVSLGVKFFGNLGDQFRINGGWKYTTGSEFLTNFHYFYLGFSYAFDLY